MREPFYAPEKTAELLDRLVKEQYEAGEVEVAHDLSNLRGMMMPFTLKDTREWEAWRNQFHQTDEQSGFPKRDVIVRGGIDMFNKLAKDVTKVSDAELEQFMKDKFNTTDTTDFVATSIEPLSKDQLERGIAFLDKKLKENNKVDFVPREIDNIETHKAEDYMPAAFSPLFGMSLINNDVYGLPNVHHHPFGDPQQLTEQCLKCRGTGVRGGSMPRNDQIAAICSRCKGTGRA